MLKNILKWKRNFAKGLAFILFVMSFLPYIPAILITQAKEYPVVYNTSPAYHYDGSLFQPGQWFGYYLVGGFLAQGDKKVIINKWYDAEVPGSLPIALTNFSVPEVGVKLKTGAYCLKPIAPNWPNTVHVYEITPELCNEFTDISEREITERDIDALNIAMRSLGLSNDGVNFTNETYAAMRFVCWYVGALGWQSKAQFMSGINEISVLFNNRLVNKSKFITLCTKTADAIEKSIGAIDTGYTEYMPAFAGRYYNQVPQIEFFDQTGDGTYTYTYDYARPYDKDWEYQCPEGVTAEYTSNSVTFKSSVSTPVGLIVGNIKAGSKLLDVVPAGGILVCKSDDPEAQDMLIPYKSNATLKCYARASEVPTTGGDSEFPPLPDVEFYKYNETFKANYNISGEKFDAETNQRLEGTEFEILEQSPSHQPSILDNYWNSKIDTWAGWKRCKRVETNNAGEFSHTDIKTYDYVGTYCAGHDDQRQTIEDYEAFIEQCEDNNTQAEADNADNPDADAEPLWDTDVMREYLANLEWGYQEQIDVCEEFSSDGENHFFHAESGTGQQKNSLAGDKQNAYDIFIDLEYDYTVREIRTRAGYILHGKHKDDNPIPVIRTTSSESGKTGYIINPDNKTAGLPEAFESTIVTKAAPFQYEGSLTRASHILPEQTKTIPEYQFKPATASDAEEIIATNSNLIRKRQSFINLNRMTTMEESTEADPPEDSEITEIPEKEIDKASPSVAKESLLFRFTQGNVSTKRAAKSGDGYSVASWEPDWQTGSVNKTTTGASGNNLFKWYIYNHRIEGDIHINKRDLELNEYEKTDNFSYGDSQGDATLEGAVYGLYAAQDMTHPDGKTGNVFLTNELISVATTDINGDASFLVITEETPTSQHVTNNYDGSYHDVDNPADYPDYKTLNGNPWIGRPLLLGRYYIKEIGRSEGYELSITGHDSTLNTNFGSTGNVEAVPGSAYVYSLVSGANSGTSGTIITIKTEYADQGVELYFYNYPATTKFGIMRRDTAVQPGQVVAGWNDREVYLDGTGNHVYENTSGSGNPYYRWDYDEAAKKYIRYEVNLATPLYEMHLAGELKKDLAGNYIQVENAAGEIQYTATPESKTIIYMAHKTPPLKPVTIPADITNVKNTANQLLKEAGYYSIVPAASKAPWVKLELTGANEQAKVKEILEWYNTNPFYNAAQVEHIVEEGGYTHALLRYDYLSAGVTSAVLYGTDLFVKETIPGSSAFYYYAHYAAGDFIVDIAGGMVKILTTKRISETIGKDDVIADHIKAQYVPQYETYSGDIPVLDKGGNPVQLTGSVPEISENTNVTATKTMDYLSDIAVYDSEAQCFAIRIRPERLTEAEKNGSFMIETEHPGMTSVTAFGQNLHVGEYLKYVLDTTAFAVIPSTDWTGTYIKDALLTYDSGRRTYQDAETRKEPILVTERVIKQQIKVQKKIQVNAEEEYDNNTNRIHKDWFTENFGGFFDRLLGTKETSVTELENFRFQIFLKSNLAGIYRDEAGGITWLDRDGYEVDIKEFKAKYPAEVQKLFTKVLHSNLLYKDSKDAVMANTELYSVTNGFISADQNPGYTQILETWPNQEYNYKKFFDALRAANADKWDNGGAIVDTSFKPFPPGNEINTSDIAKDNAKASDAVRQFALDWYQKEEIKKLVEETPAGETHSKEDNGYSDSLYDQALYEAIQKSNNYLIPFFRYDLDMIYSIEWDSEANGGKDKDTTTLSADSLYSGTGNADKYYYAASRYLPYGTYIMVEQQPKRGDLNDFANKHYQIDHPKEITLPVVYESDRPGEDGTLNSQYKFTSAKTPAQQLAEYNIRFHQETADECIIQANGYNGSYKVYKYGLDLDKINTNFMLSQEPYHPLKDYYLFQADGTNAYYLPNIKVSPYYRYASISEQAGAGTMQGMLIALEGRYAPMLIPWSVTTPAESDTYLPSQYKGYADKVFTNEFYKAKLRLEKLDAETGENVLHDNAIFAIYSASRQDLDTGDGEVHFYRNNTLIRGSKEFLQAMGATDIRPFKRGGGEIEAGASYTGMVPAGTPICKESEQIILMDAEGKRTGEFKTMSTMRDGSQADEESLNQLTIQNQNVGYLETPQPLGAGAYVILEIKPTSGYSKTKPVAMELYSDKVTYYLDGDNGNRVTSTIYKDDAGQDIARIYLHNTAVRLEINKIKTTDTDTTYDTNTRYEGTELQLKDIYGAENLEFAYNHSGKYLGYAWKKGTLEYLVSRREAGEDVEILYQDGIFAGFGRITRLLESSGDKNQNVTGAQLTLYDAIEIKANNAGGDFGYDGVTVKRDRNSNVMSVQVEQGYAGEQILFVKEKGEAYTYTDEIDDMGAGVWNYKTIQRETTDILYYSLSGLNFKEKDGDGTIIGKSVYAMKNGAPVFELIGSRLNNITYSAVNKCFSNQDADVVMYHLDEHGIRDTLVDMGTGMAYVIQDGRILVWTVQTAVTDKGAVIAKDKIQTYRIATFNADTTAEYVTGTQKGKEFINYLNPVLNPYGLPVYYQSSTEVYTKGQPIYDIDGDYVRYKYMDLLFHINQAAYQINSLQKLKDIGAEENHQDDRKLYHREGESLIMENRWVSGERYPNDPFKAELTTGQGDMLKRVIPGNYILEEITPPSGYAKSFPKPIFLEERIQTQVLDLENENIKAEIVKTDDTDTYKLTVKSDYEEDRFYTEGKGSYSYAQVLGSRLILYKANKIYTADSEKYPLGYYLDKAEHGPATWTVENPDDNTAVRITADWITDGSPKYFEGIPAGDYILEEFSAASGYVRNRMDLEVKPVGEVQTFNLKNDHTKLEIFKYYENDKKHKLPIPNSNAAGLTIYEAISDNQGNIVYQDGLPLYHNTRILDRWHTDDLKQYTEIVEKSSHIIDRFKAIFNRRSNVSGFMVDFEAEYQLNSDMKAFAWLTKAGERRAVLTQSKTSDKSDSKVQLWTTDAGDNIRITMYKTLGNGKPDLTFEYQFNYRELNGVKVYDTIEGMHRIDYIPFNAAKDGKPVGNYVLVEHQTPKGFETADIKALVLAETENIQRYSLENHEKYIHVDKVAEGIDHTGAAIQYQVPGVTLGLYLANSDGSFTDEVNALVEQWITGLDGKYSEEDKFAGNIVHGYKPGDYKPHKIAGIPYGRYYISELKVPDYMVKNPPQIVDVSEEKSVVYKVINHLSKGKLIIRKSAEDTGISLFGARFEVKNQQTEETWIVTTGADGTAILDHMSVGILQPDGTIQSHWYQVKEITPPDYYRISAEISRFQFDGTDNTETLTYEISVKNKPTSVYFTKTNFANDMLVEGAVVAIYKAKAVEGTYIKDGEAIEIIRTNSQGFTITKKLIASHAYIAQELMAPAGMLLAKPIVFVLNASGTGIQRITNDFSIITLAASNQAIESMTISGRVAVHVTVTLKDAYTNDIITVPGTEGDMLLTEQSGIKHGGIYEITEYTTYSDGNREITGKETRRITLNEGGAYRLPGRTFTKTIETLMNSQGTVIDRWEPDRDKQTHTIYNPISKEPDFLKITGGIGNNFEAVEKGSLIKYQISYPNTTVLNTTIQAFLSEGLELIRTHPKGKVNGQNITWSQTDIGGGKEGILEMVVKVAKEPGNEVSVSVKIGEAACTRTNPVAKKASLTVKNLLTGTGKDDLNRFVYHVALRDSEGVLLSGYYAYTGTESGRIKGQGQIELSGNGYIIFNNLPHGTQYEIIQKEAYGYELKNTRVTGTTGNYLASTLFENQRNDESIRDVLIKNGEYILSEITEYTDGSSQTTGKYRFRINENLVVNNIDMLDKPIDVIFSKRDVVTDREIEGGVYQLIDSETKIVLYQFTKVSYIRLPSELLVPGNTYVLRELEAPDGYAYADDILFTVSESGVPELVVMHDYQTRVEIIKINESGKLLTGSRHEILDADTNTVVIPEFMFEGKPLLISGKLLAGKSYILRETKAPSGYLIAEDVVFIVPKSPDIITVTMVDQKEPQQPNEPDHHMYLKKLDGRTKAGLTGFDFTIYLDNIPYTTVTTREDGYAKFPMPPDGSYTYQETKSNDGYMLPPESTVFTFVIKNRKVMEQSTVVVENYKAPNIPIKKVSSKTEKGLQGAEFIIKNQWGHEVFAGITDENGYVYFCPKMPGNYILEEREAPGGYTRTHQSIIFTVHTDGTYLGNLILYNNPEPEYQRTGRIMTSYKSKLSGNGIPRFWEKLPKTGDLSFASEYREKTGRINRISIKTILVIFSLIIVIIGVFVAVIPSRKRYAALRRERKKHEDKEI